METGKEQNYWPGFVDALSNVVLTLVFVLVIFVFALVMASNKVQQRMNQINENAKSSPAGYVDVQNENASLKKQVQELSDEIKKLRVNTLVGVSDQNQDKHINIDDADKNKTKQGSVGIRTTGDNTVVLNFPMTVAQMDTSSEEKLGHILDAVIKTVGQHKILLRSVIGNETISAAQRLAYYRAISARSFLITKMGEIPENISMMIVAPPQPEEGRVEIVLQKR